MSEKFALYLLEISLLSKNHPQGHFSSQGPFHLVATSTPKSHFLKAGWKLIPLDAFHMLKVELKFIKEMKAVMDALWSQLQPGGPYVQEDE